MPPDFLEYRWAVDIDSDRSGRPICAPRSATSRCRAAAAIDTADILSVARRICWEVSGAVSSTIGDVTATITGNTFRFEIDGLRGARAGGGQRPAQSTWTTFYRFGAGGE